MILDFSSFAFGYTIQKGGGTPNWATSLGQGKDYKINTNLAVNDILQGLIYKSVSLSNVSGKFGKGGKEYFGNSDNSPIILGAVFDKIYINDILIKDSKFILLLTRDDSDSHKGRLRIKYGLSNSFHTDGEIFNNAQFLSTVKSQLGLADRACWFVYEININNQDELILKTIIVNQDAEESYSTVKEQHHKWENLIKQVENDSFNIGTGAQLQDKTKKQVDKPYQRIFFGAPGTGKSYKLNEDAKHYFGDNFKRVTFHPNYMYSNFVGQYKPYPVEDNPEKITYKFVPGVLIRQIVEAFENPDKNYLVIIEEINRANVAAVFGDLFQLLDRSNDGESEYSIAVTKELQDYFRNESFVKSSLFEELQNKLNDFSELYLPHNLYIWATMNSADQGVMPMDTAFKRRWEFTYLGVNDAADNNAAEFEKYVFEVNGVKYNWDMYRRGINDRLSRLNIPEDKLLGPYFLSKNILTNENKSYIADVLKNKVLMYLYEDAGRAFRGRLFREGAYNTYSQLCAEFDKDPLSVFKEPIEISESSSEEP